MDGDEKMKNKKNPLRKLQTLGQSIWLDFLRRGMFTSGELQSLIEEDGLRGVTDNPSIFEKALAGSHDYDQAIRAMALEGKKPEEMYVSLIVEDIQRAADLFRPVYDQTGGGDGFVSLEVSPHLAHDSVKTIAEAKRFWSLVDRPNVMIKIPATVEGLTAIQQLIGEGINVNITLLFSLPRYKKVAEAYLAGLETLAAQGRSLEGVASVASFFLSRIDTLVDPILEQKIQSGGAQAERASSLHGQVAIASAKMAYQIYRDIFNSRRFQNLVNQGARTQRLLWASTSMKNPAYSDLKYVEPLIGVDTINTLPLRTLNAYRDHGHPAARLEEGVAEARDLFKLAQSELDLDRLLQQLEDEGIQKFVAAYDRLMKTLEERRAAALEEPLDRQALHLGSYESVFRDQVAGLEREGFCRKLWRKDASLWKTDPGNQEVIRNSLGWLHVAENMENNLDELFEFRSAVKAGGFRRVVHIGMGGSSLAARVFARTFLPSEDGLPLTVLDTTDPATILKVEQDAPVAETLFIVASKSGTTAETLALGDYFYSRVKDIKGDRAGENFVAITDPGTTLVALANERGFRRIFLNFTDIGGRYSALSYFGLVPAVLAGVDVPELLARALRMVHACASSVPDNENPGVILGAALGELQQHGRDKVTFITGKRVAFLGLWIEQLLAESTGKEGSGILPVVGEEVGPPEVYGEDRLFVDFHLKDETEPVLERAVDTLQKAGHPVITIRIDDLFDLGQEFARWEIATATACSILGINPFDQPNVQESKDNTARLLSLVSDQGELPEPQPGIVESPLSLYSSHPSPSIIETLSNFLSRAQPRDYLALMTYIEDSPSNEQALNTIRLFLRDSLHLATTVGFGPRYLHSTGQFHKGGSQNGLFIQLTESDAEDIPVPGKPYTFGVFKQAQALGDLRALQERGRPALRVHLGTDTMKGLAAFEEALRAALVKVEAEGALHAI